MMMKSEFTLQYLAVTTVFMLSLCLLVLNARYEFRTNHLPRPNTAELQNVLKQTSDINQAKNPKLDPTIKEHTIQSGEDNLTASTVTVKMPEQDLLGPSRKPWPDDPQCNTLLTRFGVNIPLVYLTSFPRSGNSWVRYLIEAATGVLTNSVYKEPSMKEYFGFIGEDEPLHSRRAIVTKTHTSSFADVSLERRREKYPDHVPVILLIRNPAKSLISLWNLVNAPGGNFYLYNVSDETYQSDEFHQFVEGNLRRWQEVVSDRLIWSHRLLVIAYEELVEAPMEGLKNMLKFLGVPLDPQRATCLTKYLQGPAKGAQRQIFPYKERELALLGHAIRTVHGLALLRGVVLPDYTKDLPLLNMTKTVDLDEFPHRIHREQIENS